MCIKKKFFYLSLAFIILIITSCNRIMNTNTSYRVAKNKEYYKDCGFILNCICNNNKTNTNPSIVVTVFTPETWGDFYYDFLKGEKCEKNLTLKSISINFRNNTDTLILLRKDDKNNFYFTSPNLKNEIDKFDEIEIKLDFDNQNMRKIFIFKRHIFKYNTKSRHNSVC